MEMMEYMLDKNNTKVDQVRSIIDSVEKRISGITGKDDRERLLKALSAGILAGISLQLFHGNSGNMRVSSMGEALNLLSRKHETIN